MICLGKGLIALKEKVLICIFAYAVAFLFSFNYYQSGIEMYQDALAGKIYLLPPSEESIKQHQQKAMSLQKSIQDAKHHTYNSSETQEPDPQKILLDIRTETYNKHISTPPSGANPPPIVLKQQLLLAKDKRSSLMINSFTATTVVLIGAYFYWSKRKGRNDS